MLASPGPLGLASGSPSSAPEPSREPRLAGMLPAAGRRLTGRGHPPVSRRQPTRPPFPCTPVLLKDSDSPGGGATSRGWRVVGTSKLSFKSATVLAPTSSTLLSETLYTRPAVRHGARLAAAPPSPSFPGGPGRATSGGRVPGVPRADAAGRRVTPLKASQ